MGGGRHAIGQITRRHGVITTSPDTTCETIPVSNMQCSSSGIGKGIHNSKLVKEFKNLLDEGCDRKEGEGGGTYRIAEMVVSWLKNVGPVDCE